MLYLRRAVAAAWRLELIPLLSAARWPLARWGPYHATTPGLHGPGGQPKRNVIGTHSTRVKYGPRTWDDNDNDERPVVATLSSSEPLPAGVHAWDWDGRDESGRSVASGVYLYRFIRQDGRLYFGKLALVR